ncbi:DNA-3-methyladenine glycosylase [Marinobacter nitratireducens]|uniref:DNA-3-methyladenine glycosylase I n=1 Tax=Marinobacter nitratireducens TaxID=1137280 RepID=A0A072NA36_9GAMM|nr:DNA-3-methyladenine glycosylase I [Marinobacter nitratireducens]KEF29910.1 DNA-3-methyladenine glycosylase [Marinobacter nitratireducens]
MNKERCPWCGTDPLYVHYHDTVWGRPERDDQALFEKLCLDGQQAGLSWITILRKQESYRAAYDGFDAERIIQYGDEKIAELLSDPGVIRNRLKVHSIIKNARGYLDIRENEGSFSDFLWSFVDGSPIQNRWASMSEVPVSTVESEAMSKALKRRGFTFVGPTIVYAFMQATGMVNDHLIHCPQHQACQKLAD